MFLSSSSSSFHYFIYVGSAVSVLMIRGNNPPLLQIPYKLRSYHDTCARSNVFDGWGPQCNLMALIWLIEYKDDERVVAVPVNETGFCA